MPRWQSDDSISVIALLVITGLLHVSSLAVIVLSACSEGADPCMGY